MADKKALVFAGTWEGHMLADYFTRQGYKGDFCVATEYGSEIMPESEGVRILEGRLSREEMTALMEQGGYELVIDATHPYAVIVTEYIKEACKAADKEYVRLLRTDVDVNIPGVTHVEDIEEAITVLNSSEEKVLLTTGSKDLMTYSKVKDYKERLYPRILPSHESLELALGAGIPSKNIICMQGPFTKEMNLATMKQFGCTLMLSKNTGKQGGMEDKLACIQEGFSLIVIGRPTPEEGHSFAQVIEIVDRIFTEK